MNDKRTKQLVTAVLDEVQLTESEAQANPNKIKVDDQVSVVRGALTNEKGKVTYLTPCSTLADVEYESGQFGRVPTAFLVKAKKSKKPSKSKIAK